MAGELHSYITPVIGLVGRTWRGKGRGVFAGASVRCEIASLLALYAIHWDALPLRPFVAGTLLAAGYWCPFSQLGSSLRRRFGAAMKGRPRSAATLLELS